MKRTAERRAGWRAEAVPAEVDLSGLSVERARFALGRLRAAVAARRLAAMRRRTSAAVRTRQSSVV
jgi:hypothetical protein